MLSLAPTGLEALYPVSCGCQTLSQDESGPEQVTRAPTLGSGPCLTVVHAETASAVPPGPYSYKFLVYISPENPSDVFLCSPLAAYTCYSPRSRTGKIFYTKFKMKRATNLTCPSAYETWDKEQRTTGHACSQGRGESCP